MKMYAIIRGYSTTVHATTPNRDHAQEIVDGLNMVYDDGDDHPNNKFDFHEYDPATLRDPIQAFDSWYFDDELEKMVIDI